MTTSFAEMTPEAAAAYRRVLDATRALREAQEAPQSPPGLYLRQGIIVARDPVTYTASILLGAADLADVAGDFIAGVKLADTVYPIIGASCFVAMNGSNPTVLFTVGANVGACRARRTVDTTLPNNVITPIPLGINEYDTEWDQTGGVYRMHDPAMNGTRITALWPGRYGTNGGLEFGSEGSTTSVRRIVDIRHTYAAGGSDRIARQEDRYMVASTFMTMTIGADDFKMAVGDYVELCAFQGATGSMTVTADERFSPFLELYWKGPP